MTAAQPTDIDVAAARAATPGCETSTFLLSAGSSLPTTRTLDAVIGHLRREAAIGGYGAADEAQPSLARGREALAGLIGGSPDEIAMVPSDSVAFMKAWWGWTLGGNVPAHSVVLVDRLTYHSHYAALVQTQSIVDFEIRVLPSLPDGTIELERVVIDERVSAVCATLVGTHSGNVNPIVELGALTSAIGAPLFLDACQAFGQIVVDVTELRCQVLTATGRKYLRGPRGTGVLWVSAPLIDRFVPPGIDGTSTAWTSRGLETRPGIGRFVEYETSVAAMVGLASAAEQAAEISLPAIEARVTHLGERLRTELASLPQVTVHDIAARRCGIVTFTISGIEPGAIVDTAARHGIRINESTATWAALDMEAKGIQSVVRASPHYFNTDDEIDRLVELLHALAATRHDHRLAPPPSM